MSEMVERVAKAIFETWAEAEGSETTWDALVQMQGMDGYANSKKHYKMAFDEARAAIEALRKPTSSMLAEAVTVDDEMSEQAPEKAVTLIWWAMLDEALK